MSRKQQPKEPSGPPWDARCGAVRAQGAPESMRDKVQAVRAVVPNRSNTEIVLVLQHFDNAVDRAVQAFMEGNASEVLKEWTVTGKKKNKKKKPKAPAPPGPSPPAPGPQEKLEKLGNLGNLENSGMAINGFHGNRAPSLESLPEAGAAQRGPSLERSLKDLQRCSVALARFRALLRDEVESSLRRVRGAFGEIQSCLMDREVALLAEMDKVKAEAMDLLSLRQRRAEALRALTEAAPGMSEEQLQELRADIKHFVSERKFDEELGRAGRFGCDLEALRGSIGAFGQVSHPRPSYSSRSRCSSGPGATGSGMGPGTGPGSTTGSTMGPGTGSGMGSTMGSAPGSAPAFPAGSAPGSPPAPPEFPPGSAPGPPEGSAAPTEPPPTPQPPQRSRKPPGAAGPRPSPQRPPGTPKNPESPKNPQNPQNPKPPETPRPPGDPKSPGDPKNPKTPGDPKNPKSPQNPKSPGDPKSPQNPKSPGDPRGARSRPGPRRSRPEGANS